mmetsp:Transcript_8474/g.13933  ORF Transcript_8474/g.13933 Transcript_8474/m.13933 type:complete len:101 (+) Transcript_8474:712-1014(+)
MSSTESPTNNNELSSTNLENASAITMAAKIKEMAKYNIQPMLVHALSANADCEKTWYNLMYHSSKLMMAANVPATPPSKLMVLNAPSSVVHSVATTVIMT